MKRLFTLLLVCILMLTVCVPALAAKSTKDEKTTEDSTYPVVGTVSSKTYILNKASSSGKRLGTVAKNGEIVVTGFKGTNYAVVDHNGTEAYINAKYLKVTLPDGVYGKVTSSQYVYTKESLTSSSRIKTKVAKGAQMELVARTKTKWQVEIDGETYYISASKVTYEGKVTPTKLATVGKTTTKPTATPATTPKPGTSATPAPSSSSSSGMSLDAKIKAAYKDVVAAAKACGYTAGDYNSVITDIGNGVTVSSSYVNLKKGSQYTATIKFSNFSNNNGISIMYWIYKDGVQLSPKGGNFTSTMDGFKTALQKYK